MSVSLYSVKFVRTMLLLQLVTFVVIGAFFAFKDLTWSLSALIGGLAAWLPNVFFMIFAWCHRAGHEVKGRLAWTFVLGEALKVIVTVLVLIVGLSVFKAAFFPLGLTWLSVLMVQIIAPTVINNKG
ncbi:F0F1 ATP synthase subunit I [Erwinia tracheiphila]|uniref:ATP F0F1 synthase subunit I n=1 Tax=Erwinia tracheiphila TaxID=65700 RepID=A0A0M2KHA4_9GAMM|nr:F0F1 ATP synthase subunit I [Erwinia tracheiphila]AXF77784.1 F0F1 ATP synthase subunit I [Erwinia tracheiphila]EOS93508.1 F0F1 ATP synthase subunit I [Erwinia tracheiphila PSU-1]KKF36608.1 ATP F0F1 synthase subunit I [Erwinia tracheiphila]UIA83522.1 F0F1 ATP synthase subunit I [Erwinia tracheiphila]UIA87942.1 F0F1 ATP synthase subunit I [Erwinia tracheiphila]